MRKFYLLLLVAFISYVPLDVFSQNPYIMTDGGLGSYGYIEKDATSNIYFRANSNSQSNIYQLFVRSLINGSTNYLTYGTAVNTCGATTNVTQQTFSYTFPSLNNGSQVLSSVHADYCGGTNSYSSNPNQQGYNQRTFQVVDVYSDNNSIATQLLPTPSMPNNVVLSFVIDPGGVSGITFKGLSLTNAGTATEVTDIPNNGFKLYYENYTGSESFGGTELFEQLTGNYDGNTSDNNYGAINMNSSNGITIPSTGLRCYVVLATTNDCSIAGKSVKLSIKADGISFSNSIDGYPNLKMDQLPASGGTTLTATGNVYVTATSGTTTGGYCTLKAAFDAINAGTHKGAIAISIYGNTTETLPAQLRNSGYSGLSSYSSVSIQPTGGAARTISGSLDSTLVDFYGATNVTVDGLNTGSNSLTFSNTSATSKAVTIRFAANAGSSTVKNCTILGSTTGSSTANIQILTTALISNTGINNLTIDNNNIGPVGTNYPAIGIYSVGTSSYLNSNCTVTNNNIYDFFNASNSNTAGVYLGTGNSAWTISNNKIYYSSSTTRTFSTTQRRYSGIAISQSGSGAGNSFTVNNNIIGYGSSSQTGTTTLAGSSNEIRGIYMKVGTSSTSTVQSNTIGGFTQTSSRGSTTVGNNTFIGIQVDSGNVDIKDNIIGSQSATSITVNSTSTAGAGTFLVPVTGIYNGSGNGTSTTISGNTIGGFTVQLGAGGTNNTVGFAGIEVYMSVSSATASVTGNTIGGTSAGNIMCTNKDGGMDGIIIDSAVATVTGNIIRNMTFSGTPSSTTVIGLNGISIWGGSGANTISTNKIYSLSASSTSAYTQVAGIMMAGGVGSYTFNSDTIYSLSTSSAGTHDIRQGGSASGQSSYVYSSLMGICINPGYGNPGDITVSGNVIYTLQANSASAVNPSVIGIATDAGTTTANNIVSANKIYGLENKATASAAPFASVVGIRAFNGKWRFDNNMIALTNGGNQNNAWLFGIAEVAGFSSSTTSAYYYNSVYIAGTIGGAGTAFSAAYANLYGGTSADILNNNSFVNVRNNGSGNAYGMYFYVNPSTYNGDYNNIYSQNGSIGRYNPTNYATLTTWQTATGKDANSISSNITYYNTATGDLHITNAASVAIVQNKGVDVSPTVTKDFDGETRKTTCKPDIGADEIYLYSGSTDYVWIGRKSSNWCDACNWEKGAVPTSSNNAIIPTSSYYTNAPVLDGASGCTTATTANLTVNSGGTVTMNNSSVSLTVNGNFSNAGTFALTGGNLNISGNFSNTSTFTHNTSGTVSFTGASTQTISSTSDLSFYNLTFSGGGAKSLTANATVNGTLGLTSGVVTLSSGNYLAMPAGVSYTGGGSSSYINGTIRKYFNSSETSFTFPTGNATRYGPVTLSNISAPSTSEYMAVSYATGPFSGDHRNILTPVPAAPTNSVQSVDFASYVEYWNMSFSNTSSAFKAQLTLNYTNNSYSQLYNKGADWLRVTRYDGIGVLDYGNDNPLGDQSSGVSGSINSANQLAASVFSSGSIFTFGTTANGVNPLPAILKSFSASKQTGYNKLDWNVSCQGKSLQFDVLRSADGRNFQSIYSFGADQNRCNQPFAFNDYGASGAKIYYRIKITDENGKVIYTQVAVIINRDKGFEITGLMPNPATEVVYLNISSGSRDKLQLVVTDITGKQVMSNTVMIAAGSNMVSLPVRNLAKGVYSISGVYSDGRTGTLRFVKQ